MKPTTKQTTNQIWAQAYDIGFSDGFRAACDPCWSKGFDEGLKEASEEER
jgi:tRNA U34 5-methylaminomethyl-2-thiouridine-forming methyltransferase MnmC